MIKQVFQIMFETFNAVFSAVLDFLPTAKVFSDLKVEMIALVLGIPAAVLIVLKYIIKIVRILNGYK